MGLAKRDRVEVEQGCTQFEDEECAKGRPSTVAEKPTGEYSEPDKFIEVTDKDFQEKRNLRLLRLMSQFLHHFSSAELQTIDIVNYIL